MFALLTVSEVQSIQNSAVAKLKDARMSKRREPQQERAIARKQRIIDATKLVLIELGYSKLTLRKIASAAGIGVGTIYDYFPTKFAVVEIILGQRLSEKLDAFDQAYASVTPENSIAEFIDRYIATVTGGPSAVRLDNALFASINDDAGLAKLMNRYQSDTVDRYVEALETAGSTWSRHDLRGAANYLASIASHFEQNLEKHRHEGRTQLMQKMVQDTFIAIARSTLKPVSVVKPGR